ncbi:MAG: carboxypeptidase M32 [Acidobacteriota bacterium]
MDINAAERRLDELWGEIRDISAAGDLLEWDQDTNMPPAGIEARGKMVATLEGFKHRSLASPELQEVLAVCAEGASDSSLLAAKVRRARLDVDRAVQVPQALVQELAEAGVRGFAAWRRAREAADFSLFADDLEKMVALRREEAAAMAPDGRPYDAMLGKFEPGMTETELEPLFDGLRDELIPLVRSVAEHVAGDGAAVDESAAQGEFPPDKQHDFGRYLAQCIGFDFEAGRLDQSTHPFCIGIDRGDVRMTWRYEENDFRAAVFGILHESGHGMYEQGLPAEWGRSPVGSVVSLGIHESQSRLWENHVGRSRGFWRWALPHYRAAFPDAPASDAATLWRLLHTVKPSLIRVEADEGTYNLHVIARFELERRLFGGALEVADLPAAWDDAYEELLGIRPPDAALGVLQDIHWSQGMFGYFPTYTLGTMAAAQLFAAAGRDLGDLEAAFAEGEFKPLLAWLRDKIHRHGSRYTAKELIEQATGKPLAPDDLLAYLRETTEEVYGVGGSG